MFNLNFYEMRVSARKLLRNNEDHEYPIYLLAAYLKAKEDGIDVNALKDALSNLKVAETTFELGFDD